MTGRAALACPECGERVWDGPRGSRLAKCWNTHADGGTLAFDTMEEEGTVSYVVIENTPGYMPDDDDRFVTDDYAAACEYVRELTERLMDLISEGGGEPAATFGEGHAFVTDMAREHDLGRVIEVMESGDES